jgi:NADH:ubiquinone oxidoreductase subunit K
MSAPTLQHYLIFSALLFCVGLFGLLTRRHLVGMLMSVELILNAAALNFVAFHHFVYPGAPAGAVFPLFIIAIAAAEAVIVLAIIIVIFRHKQQLDVEEADQLKH